ncbi:MAG: cobalt transporter CbiM [Geitlerinemataceae cyanobacterium]
MHIADGFLPARVCILGYAATGGLAWYSLRRIAREANAQECIPKTALLSAAFFAVSSLHIPIPPTSVHPILNGLLGAVLGIYAFPAILVGLFFQAVMFHHGGMSVLGVNALIMGIPAIVAAQVFQWRGLMRDRRGTTVFAFIAGALGVGLSTLLFYAIAVTNIPAEIDVMAERSAIGMLTLSQLPLTIVEACFTAMLVSFLQQVKPDLIEGVGVRWQGDYDRYGKSEMEIE